MFYVEFNDGVSKPCYSAHRGPNVMPQPGQTLVALHNFCTPAHEYKKGDTFLLIERTEEAPWNIKCSLGNWRVQDKYFTSVWANIEWALNDGLMGFQAEVVL